MDSQLCTGDLESLTGVVPVGSEVMKSIDGDSCSSEVNHVKMWQKSNYLVDSGIHSALGTQTPSVCGGIYSEEFETEDHVINDKPCSVGHWPSGYPMSVHPNDSCLLSPGTPSTSSMVGIDTPGASHSTSNLDLRGNKLPDIDTDEAAGAIPDLVKLIKDEDDQVVIYQSSMMVFQLSKSEAIDALIKSKDMIECIISALDRAEDPETVRFLSGTLYNMSQTQTGLKAIFAANCVNCLVKLLNSPVESVLFYSITTLHNLLLHQEGAKKVVRESGCLQKMTYLLRKNNIKFLTICTDCLQILAYGHQESKLQILSAGGPTELVRILRNYQYEKLLWTTARVLKVLTVCTSNKPAIIAAGGMDALAKHLNNSSNRLLLNCLWALRNLSDAATKLDDLQPLLQSLVQLLEGGDGSIVTCAAGILSNLTCNNYSNKYIVYKLGGIAGLLRAIGQPGIKEDILEPCMCALRHLTSRHEEEENARRMIVHGLNGLPDIARILHAATAGICPELGLVCQPPHFPVTSWMLIKAMVGLLRNLSVNLDSHNVMRDCGLVKGLFLLLYAAQYEIQKQTSSGSSNAHLTFATVVQSVRLEEIVEGICGALHMLVKDHATRSYLALLTVPNLLIYPGMQPGSSGLAIFVHLLYSAHESIQRAAAGLLTEVSQDRDGLEALVNIPNAMCRFDELVNSRNEAIATYASAVVIRMNERREGALDGNCLFSLHIDGLNTPPVPMDTMGFYSGIGESIPCASPSAVMRHTHHMGAPLPPTSPIINSCYYNSRQRSSSPPVLISPHNTSTSQQNTLIAMLGPPPSVSYKVGAQNCSMSCCPSWTDDCCSDSHCQYSMPGNPCSLGYCSSAMPPLAPYSSPCVNHCSTGNNPCAPFPVHHTSDYASPPPPSNFGPRRSQNTVLMETSDYPSCSVSGDTVLAGGVGQPTGSAQPPPVGMSVYSGRPTVNPNMGGRSQRPPPPAYYHHHQPHCSTSVGSMISPLPGQMVLNPGSSSSGIGGFHSPLEDTSSGASCGGQVAANWLPNAHHSGL